MKIISFLGWISLISFPILMLNVVFASNVASEAQIIKMISIALACAVFGIGCLCYVEKKKKKAL